MKNSFFISETEGLTVTNFNSFDTGHDIKIIDIITFKTVRVKISL